MIIGDLQVIGMHRKAHKKGRERKAREPFSPQGHQDAHQCGRYVGRRPHLGIVARSVGDDEKGRKSEGDAANACEPRIHPFGDQQQIHAEHQ